MRLRRLTEARHERIAHGLLAALLLVVATLYIHAASRAETPLAEWTRLAEQIRGLSLDRPVALSEQPRSAVRAHVAAEIDRLRSAAELRAYRDAYAALGVLPADLELRALLADLYAERLAGRYSREERTLYLFGDARRTASHRMLAVHELVHALQDQHFPQPLALLAGLRHNDDLALALAAAAEGDASLAMLGARTVDGAGPTAAEIEAGVARAARVPAGGAIDRAPEWVRASVVFPYATGLRVAAARHAAEGRAGVDAMLADPALSSRELLMVGSADDALREIEVVRLPLDRLPELAGSVAPAHDSTTARASCRVAHHNAAGALTLRSLLRDAVEPGARDRAVAAWRGDRFAHVVCEEDAGLVWVTSWRDAAAAQGFADAYRATLAPSARARVEVSERRVLVGTGALATDALDEVLRESEIRAYGSLTKWIEDGCFGEPGGCPAFSPDAGQPGRQRD